MNVITRDQVEAIADLGYSLKPAPENVRQSYEMPDGQLLVDQDGSVYCIMDGEEAAQFIMEMRRRIRLEGENPDQLELRL